ncbi:substrate-binding periplasmic protein [Rheinheimera maricola]|uniref:Transporter substrate-binding domain-containing protein n=1 Tax=Rheinheimera maricola TaxID=2793282 RepID=A0ABS7X7V9_9GAMM|nr:transporter substrate-binding domain-containing protein [Rheinheimera maricola]MBZ9611628.1 transporter substrate-binding domain-containing protein [Rheinheimera maricola]
MSFGVSGCAMLLFSAVLHFAALGAEGDKKLNIHYPQLPPFIYLNGQSEQVTGILPEVFAPFFSQQGLDSRYVFNHPQRAEQALYHGEIDAMFVSPAWVENPDALLFSVTVLSYDDYLFSLKAEDTTLDLTDVRELKICTREHYVYPELQPYFSQQGFIRIDASSQEAQLKMLLNQRCDLAYMNDIIVRWLMQQQVQPLTIYALPQAAARASLRLSLHPRWRELLPALNEFILQQQQSGAISQAIQRYAH